MARTIPPTDALVILMGAPHADDLVTNALRLVQAMLDAGGSVAVWTCGYATLLTGRGSKPRNLAEWSREYPSTSELVLGMLETHPGRLFWYVCRFCSDDRGVTEHLSQVVARPPAGYEANVAAAAKSLLVGVI